MIHLKETGLVFLGAILAVIGQWYLTSKGPKIIYKCPIREIKVGQELQCTDFTLNSEKTKWDFGDGKPSIDITTKKAEEIKHRYEEHGIFHITIDAEANFGAQQARDGFDITVKETYLLKSPFNIKILGIAAANTSTEQITFPISQLKDDHPSMSSDTRSYSIPLPPLDPALKIKGTRFVENSANNAAHIIVPILSPNQAAVNFTLTSGPLYDRWRGWLTGDAIITAEREIPGSEFILENDLYISSYADYSIQTKVDVKSLERVLIVDAKTGETLAEGTPNKPLISVRGDIEFSLINRSIGSLSLIANPYTKKTSD